MHRPIAIIVMSLLLAACAAVNGTPGNDSGGSIHLLPPGPAVDEVRTTELALSPDSGPARPRQGESL